MFYVKNVWFFQWILKDALKVTSNLSYHIMQNASFNLIASKKKNFMLINDYQEMEVTWSHTMVDSKKQSHSSMKCQYWTLMTSLFPSVFLPGWYSFINISSVLFTLASLKVLIKYCSWLFFSQFNVSNLIDIYSDFIYNETTKKWRCLGDVKSDWTKKACCQSQQSGTHDLCKSHI